MYYLRKASYEETIPEIIKTDGEVIPERKEIVGERAIFKSCKTRMFLRRPFIGLEDKEPGMELYTCKTLEDILALRGDVFKYSGEWFDIYDTEQGIVIISTP